MEEYHKSLKSDASLEKSPSKKVSKKVRTQTNHTFSSIYAFVKLERLKLATKMNHFAIRRSSLYLRAVLGPLMKIYSGCGWPMSGLKSMRKVS